jgi:YggT family protein
MMGGGYLSQAGLFLVETLFSLYILAVLLRFLFQLVRADFYNPISQFLVTVTNPPLRPLRRAVPGLWGIDIAAVLLLLALTVLKLYVLYLLLGQSPGAGGVLVMAVADLLNTTIWVFIVALFIRVILSWVNPGTYNPALGLLYSLTEPLMRPARRLLPAVGGLDLSPIVIFILLYLSRILIVAPLMDLGRALAS